MFVDMKIVLTFSFGWVIAYISLSKAETQEKMKDDRIFKFTNLWQLNVNLVDHLENYIKALDTKLQIINEALIDMATYHIQHESDNMSIVSSPVGSFSLIRHMQSDWTHWQLFLQEDPGKDEMESLISKNSYLPTKEDISEVCKNISSIIKAYDLHPQDFARRFLSGVQLNSMLSPRDCLQLADHSITNKDFNMSVQWLQVAISMLDNHSNQDRIHPLFHLNTADLYLKLAEVYVKQSLWPLALQTLDTALKSQPWNAKLLTMQEHLSSQILLDPPSSPDLSIRSNQYKLQGNRRLYCFYQRKKEYPFLLFAPFKAEIIFLKPLIVLSH
ncbi:prolyl 4-hydroxylase subunit alpha-2-like [Drosophila gunungcola]|uniref:prolyl 4-hydroxylase subunit alpha-2-like n=1 Tax=Drosophila gunungcola TaxID=103775 RepID=UPI0022E439E4|nr:prolyl 4-hydroxylase subunit alpha-2-like [Drosophila gunungcola]